MKIVSLHVRLVVAAATVLTTSLLFPATAAANHENAMAGVGDSITSGFGAGGAKFNFPSESWSTGNNPQVNSHFLILNRANPALTQVNVAKPGARMAKVLTQIIDVPRNAGYVTLTAGSTEVCASTQGDTNFVLPETFGKDFRSVLTQLRAQARGARVLVLSVPNWFAVWEDHQLNGEMQTRWANGNACPMLMGPTADATTRQAVNGIIQAYNSQLGNICAEFADFCVWDQLATWNLRFSSTELSAYDGLHPSVSGQAKIAAATAHLAGFLPHAAPAPVPAATDTTPPALSFRMALRMKLLRAISRGVPVTIGCDEACNVVSQLRIGARLAKRLGLARVIGRASEGLIAGETTREVIQMKRKAKRKLRKMASVRILVRVIARDAAGNTRVVSRRAILRR